MKYRCSKCKRIVARTFRRAKMKSLCMQFGEMATLTRIKERK